MKQLKGALFLAIFAMNGLAYADVASTEYVNKIAENKVSTTGDAPQTMSGTYIVTGTFEVPDAPLPSAVIE